MGCGVTLGLLSLSLSIVLTNGITAYERDDIAYVSDPVGNVLSKPSELPALVGSPSHLAQPDRYEFYTFDETGELIKRLMTLDEIQEIIATGDGDEGHLLTVAHADASGSRPSPPTISHQPVSNLKVHTIVNTVQNVLKAEMEAQKSNPPKPPAMLDTPDVSDSWSMILPAIFGNTGGNISPDSIVSSHVEPETDVIGEVLEKHSVIANDDDDTSSKDAEDLLVDSEILEGTTVPPAAMSTQSTQPATKTTAAKVESTTPTIKTTTGTTSTTVRVTSTTESKTKAPEKVNVVLKTTSERPISSSTVASEPITVENRNRTTEKYVSSTTPKSVDKTTVIIKEEVKTTTTKRPGVPIKVSSLSPRPFSPLYERITNRPSTTVTLQSSSDKPLITSSPKNVTKRPTSVASIREPTTTPTPVIIKSTTTERPTSTAKVDPPPKAPTEEIPQLNIGEIISQIASDLKDPNSTPSYIDTSSIVTKEPTTTTKTTTTGTATASKVTQAPPSSISGSSTTSVVLETRENTPTTQSSSTEASSFVKILPIEKTKPSANLASTEGTPTTFETVEDNGDEYLDDYLESTTYSGVTRPTLDDELSDSITDLISQIVDGSKQTVYPMIDDLTTDKSTTEYSSTKSSTNEQTKKPIVSSTGPPKTTEKVPAPNVTKSPVKSTTVSVAQTSSTQKASEAPTTYRPVTTEKVIRVSSTTQKTTSATSTERSNPTTEKVATTVSVEPENETTTTGGGTTEDLELMEMLSQVSQIFQISPKLESKSDDSEVELPKVHKVTSYKKTDEDVDLDVLALRSDLDKKVESDNETKSDNLPQQNEVENSTTMDLEITTQSTLTTEPDVENKTAGLEEVTETLSPESTTASIDDDEKPDRDEPVQSNEQLNFVKIAPITKDGSDLIQNEAKEDATTTEESSGDFENITDEVLVTTTNVPHVTEKDRENSQDQVFIEEFVRPAIPQRLTIESLIKENSTDATKSDEKSKKPPVEENSSDKLADPPNAIENDGAVQKPQDDSWKLVTISTTSNVGQSNLAAERVESSSTKPKVSTVSYFTSIEDDLDDLNTPQGLEVTTKNLNDDVQEFSLLCNELAFKYWTHVSSGLDSKRSFVTSPFAVISLLSMIFLGARGATSGEMNDILKLDDMVTFNPHIVFKNVTESIEVSKRAGVSTSAFVRELFSDRSKGRLLSFYKDRVQQFYGGYVEEVNYKNIGDVVRRRTNLLVKRHTWDKIPEYIKTNNMVMKPPLSVFAANIFQTDCTAASTEGRDGEMSFVVSPAIRQRKLVLVPAVLYRSGFLAGYVPELDATIAAVGGTNQIISTVFAMPGQLGSTAHGDHILDLQERLTDSAFGDRTWSKMMRSLKPREGFELQIPRFSHRSVENGSDSLQRMGLRDLFSSRDADLRGLNGIANDLFVSDMMLINTFSTCGEGLIGDQHHVEVYPGEPNKNLRRLWRTQRPSVQEHLKSGEGGVWEEPRDYQRAFHDPLHDTSYLSMPLHLRPRQARLPDIGQEHPRLKFDRPFLFFVRHNPSGLILYMGRYNPRLLP